MTRHRPDFDLVLALPPLIRTHVEHRLSTTSLTVPELPIQLHDATSSMMLWMSDREVLISPGDREVLITPFHASGAASRVDLATLVRRAQQRRRSRQTHRRKRR